MLNKLRIINEQKSKIQENFILFVNYLQYA